jgi:regulatory protein
MRITSIQRLPRKRLYEVTVDFVLVTRLSPDILVQAGLAPGQEVTPDRLAELEQAEARHSAMAASLRVLAYRPRSEKEMASLLKRRRVPEDIAAETLARLHELGLLNDAHFAASYVEARNRTSPRSRRLIAAELAAKGVPRAVSDQPLSAVDEMDAGYRAAIKRARAMARLPYPAFERRLGHYLLGRGFSFEVARRTIRATWAEIRPGEPAGEQALDG